MGCEAVDDSWIGQMAGNAESREGLVWYIKVLNAHLLSPPPFFPNQIKNNMFKWKDSADQDFLPLKATEQWHATKE